MKPYLAFLIFFAINTTLYSVKVHAQSHYSCKKYYDKNLHMQIYTEVDQEPHFPKGDIAMLEFIRRNLQTDTANYPYPSTIYSFVVNSRGKILNAKIYKKKAANYTQYDKDALKMINKMPRWVPGKCGSVCVSTLYLLPIKV